MVAFECGQMAIRKGKMMAGKFLNEKSLDATENLRDLLLLMLGAAEEHEEQLATLRDELDGQKRVSMELVKTAGRLHVEIQELRKELYHLESAVDTVVDMDSFEAAADASK